MLCCLLPCAFSFPSSFILHPSALLLVSRVVVRDSGRARLLGESEEWELAAIWNVVTVGVVGEWLTVVDEEQFRVDHVIAGASPVRKARRIVRISVADSVAAKASALRACVGYGRIQTQKVAVGDGEARE